MIESLKWNATKIYKNLNFPKPGDPWYDSTYSTEVK